MNKILYAFSDQSEIIQEKNLEILKYYRKDSEILVEDYFTLYKGLMSQIDGCEALIIDVNFLESELEVFEFATYLRLMKDKYWDIPIFIYSNIGLLGLINLMKSDLTNITKTNRLQIINNDFFKNDALTGKSKLFNNLEIIKNEKLDWEKFVKTIEIKNIESNNHTIANEWAIYRWSHVIGVEDKEIKKIEEKINKNLYFKYLQAIYPISKITKIEKNQLKIKNLKDSKILYIDDEADKGWNGILREILQISDVQNFNILGDELKGKSKEEIIDLATQEVKELDADIVILDFRLHEIDFSDDISQVTGLQILKKIKKINPGIQVIIFSATNKIWNLQAIQEAGADGFIIKELPENSIDSNFTKHSIDFFVELLNKSMELSFLKNFYEEYNRVTTEILPRKSFKHQNPLDKKFIEEYLYYLELGLNSIKKDSELETAFIMFFIVLENIANNVVNENDIEEELNGKNKNYIFSLRNGKKIKAIDIGETVTICDYPHSQTSKIIYWKPKIINVLEFLGYDDNIFKETIDLVEKRNKLIHLDATNKKRDIKDKINLSDLKLLYRLITQNVNNL